MKRREEDYILVPATFRERKGFLNENPRTYEQILAAEREAAEREAAERKRLADEKAAEEKRAGDEAAALLRQQAEEQYAARFPRRLVTDEQL